MAFLMLGFSIPFSTFNVMQLEGHFKKVDSINYWKIRGEKALGGK